MNPGDSPAETITIECSVSSCMAADGEVWPSVHTVERGLSSKKKSSVNIAVDMTCSPESKSHVCIM